MAHTTTSIGVCPRCEASLTPAMVLIEYVRDDGEPSKYAACPTCSDVVRPR